MSAPLIDTDMLSAAAKRRDPRVIEASQKYLDKHAAYHFSVVTTYEVLHGYYKVRATSQLHAFQQLRTLSVEHPLSIAVLERAAKLYADMERIGRQMSHPDAFIAATALELGVTLVTGNTKHFEKVPGLTIENWRGAEPAIARPSRRRIPMSRLRSTVARAVVRFGKWLEGKS